MNTPKKSCATCRYHAELKHDKLVGQVVMQCWKNPPQFAMIPTPQGMAPVYTMPQVTANTFCFSHDEIPDDSKPSLFIGPHDSQGEN